MMQQESHNINGPQSGAEMAHWNRRQGRLHQMHLGSSCQQASLSLKGVQEVEEQSQAGESLSSALQSH